MTLPKRHLAGQVAHITRQITQRIFLLTPDQQNEIANAIGYYCTLTAKRHDIELHGGVIMCNHIHVCITDKQGDRSRFMQDFFHLCAKFINHFF